MLALVLMPPVLPEVLAPEVLMPPVLPLLLVVPVPIEPLVEPLVEPAPPVEPLVEVPKPLVEPPPLVEAPLVEPLMEPSPPAEPLPVEPPPPAVPVPLLEPPMSPEASMPEAVPMLSVLMVDSVVEVLVSPTVLSVLLWQAPSSPVPRAMAAKNTEGFFVNIIVERLVGLLKLYGLCPMDTDRKTRIFLG